MNDFRQVRRYYRFDCPRWRDQGERTQARDLLAPVYGWFTEGFGTAVTRLAQSW
jgi:hypothetical protein